MAYIGKEPAVGNFVKLDAISTSSTNTYNLTLDSVAFTPESANHMLVSLNGILQKPNSSFTVSGSTITFASNLATGDVIDFIMLLGNVLDIGTPSDSTVTDAKTNFVTTSSAAGLQIKGDGSTAGALQLNCEQNSHGIKIQSPPHSANQSYTLKFPSGNVTAGKFLKVDSVSGSGTTGVGTMTFADAGGGKVLQAVSAIKTDTQTVNSTGFTDISGLTVDITPSATTSKVLVLAHITLSSGNHGHTRCVRGSTVIGAGTASSSRGAVSGYANSNSNSANVQAFVFLDSPNTTSSTTYHFELESNNGAASYINRTVNDSDAIYGSRGSSTIVCMEIGA